MEYKKRNKRIPKAPPTSNPSPLDDPEGPYINNPRIRMANIRIGANKIFRTVKGCLKINIFRLLKNMSNVFICYLILDNSKILTYIESKVHLSCREIYANS